MFVASQSKEEEKQNFAPILDLWNRHANRQIVHAEATSCLTTSSLPGVYNVQLRT